MLAKDIPPCPSFRLSAALMQERLMGNPPVFAKLKPCNAPECKLKPQLGC